MSQTGSDRALRRLVAELAAAHPEDRAEVLAALPPGAQAALRDLLARYDGAEVAPAQAAPGTGAQVIPGLSAWLAARLEDELDLPARPGGGVAPFVMTPQARAALRAAAEPLPRALPPAPDAGPARGAFARLMDGVRSWR